MSEPTQIEYNVKLKAGGLKIPVRVVQEGKRLYFHFGYNKALLDEIKMMEGRKYHGFDEHNPRKVWSVPMTPRNLFQFAYLLGKDPYKAYDAPLLNVTSERPLKKHQLEFKAHCLTRRQCIVAGDMGTGKTLAVIEVMEASGMTDWIYVAPRSALRATDLEFEKWNAKITPRFFTYEGLKKEVENWPTGKKAPEGVIFDESSRLKNITAQRTQAAKHLADSIREDHGNNGFVILMSGTPAPKDPTNWWSQAEIACPGFLREGDIFKFRETLGITQQRETSPGAGSYPHLVAWRDDEKKCNICGQLDDHVDHHPDAIVLGVQGAHPHVPCVNEVARLHKRLNGLVIVRMKKDCLDLPEKQYELVRLKPSNSVMNAARMIKRRSRNTITALTLLRELSDGFQYEDTDVGFGPCPVCNGTKVYKEFYDPEDENGGPASQEAILAGRCKERTCPCPRCDGTGEIVKTSRTAVPVPTPKEDLLCELLDKYSDVGRFVTYAGFEGSVDRIVGICHKEKWATIRVDGRGWFGQLPDGQIITDPKLLKVFQYGQSDYEKVVFVGQPGAAGMGLTLTASPAIFYWSNSFDGEARIQSEDRIHRLGMDENRGATIWDCIHLPTDEFVLANLQKKRKLQDLTLGMLDSYLMEGVDGERIL